MSETPDTSGNQPQAQYRTVEGVVSGEAASTQAQAPQVRTVPTRSTEGHVSLRYTPMDQGGGGSTSTGE
jgi:hypothetical protein